MSEYQLAFDQDVRQKPSLQNPGYSQVSIGLMLMSPMPGHQRDFEI